MTISCWIRCFETQSKKEPDNQHTKTFLKKAGLLKHIVCTALYELHKSRQKLSTDYDTKIHLIVAPCEKYARKA